MAGAEPEPKKVAIGTATSLDIMMVGIVIMSRKTACRRINDEAHALQMKS